MGLRSRGVVGPTKELAVPAAVCAYIQVIGAFWDRDALSCRCRLKVDIIPGYTLCCNS